MKKVGIVFIAFGFALMLFIFYKILDSGNRMKSPIPENNGVKVIYISPTK